VKIKLIDYKQSMEAEYNQKENISILLPEYSTKVAYSCIGSKRDTQFSIDTQELESSQGLTDFSAHKLFPCVKLLKQRHLPVDLL
jgi:hypothetical protein